MDGRERQSQIAPVEATGRYTGEGGSPDIHSPTLGLCPVSFQGQARSLPVGQAPGIAFHVLESGIYQRHVERDAGVTIRARAIHHHLLVGSE